MFPTSGYCTTCSRTLEVGVFGDHAVSCYGVVGLKHRHNLVRDTLLDVCSRSGISAAREVNVGLLDGEGRSLRPADVLLYSCDGGKDVCVDLTGSSPLTQSAMADFVPGQAVVAAAFRKWAKYQELCAAKGKRVLCTSSIASNVSPTKSTVPRLVYQGCKLIGCGSAVPKLQISNDDLSKMIETSDEWISTRTGIRNRRVLSGDASLVGLATEAAKNALEMAQIGPDDIDLVLLCSSTPEDLFGSAPQIQRALGCTKSPLAYDITAACSGFMLGLVSAACHIRGGGFKNVLVVAADALSRFVDWTDRGTCILFGDASGAVVVQACDAEEDGIFSFDLHSDGDGIRHLNSTLRHSETNGEAGTNGALTGFPPQRSAYSCINMNGKEVFRFAARCVPQSIEAALHKAGLNSSTVDWLLLHQANQRIIDAVATRLEFPSEKVISNLANYGNTSAASIPLALDEAVRSGKVKPGHVIAASGFGAGLTWGSAIIRWG